MPGWDCSGPKNSRVIAQNFGFWVRRNTKIVSKNNKIIERKEFFLFF